MAARSGSRVIDARKAGGLLGKDFGEDWVVPKTEVRYLVTRRVGQSLLVTAYGKDGQVVGERLFPEASAGAAAMKRLFDERLVEAWRDIPDGLESATRFLDS